HTSMGGYYNISRPPYRHQFDQIWLDPDGETVYLIEAKGGNTDHTSIFCTRQAMTGRIVQQGTGEYRDDIILELRENLGADNPITILLENARDNNKLHYILIQQKITSVQTFIVKEF